MADDAEYNTFEHAQSGASATYPLQCSALRKGGHVVIKNRPCKIVEMSTSKTGKHGHAKIHLTAIDIFTTKKLEELCPSTHNMDVPNVGRREYSVLDVDEKLLSLMDENGDQKEDVNVPEGTLGERIHKLWNLEKHISVIVLAAMGEEQVVDVKELPNP